MNTKTTYQRRNPSANEAVARLGIPRRTYFSHQSGVRAVARRTAALPRLIEARPEPPPVLAGAAP